MQSINDDVANLVRAAVASTVTLEWIKNQTATVRDRLRSTPYHRELQQRLDRLRRRLEDDRDLLHQVTCTIIGAFDIRVLPWLDVGQMVAQKGPRALTKEWKRKGLLLAHGLFRQRLIHHCSDASIKSRRIVWVTEQFTSKLCGCCFRYCGYLRGSRRFKCPHRECGVHLSRDGNAARNIWIWAWLLMVDEENRKDEAAKGTTEQPVPKSKLRWKHGARGVRESIDGIRQDRLQTDRVE